MIHVVESKAVDFHPVAPHSKTIVMTEKLIFSLMNIKETPHRKRKK